MYDSFLCCNFVGVLYRDLLRTRRTLLLVFMTQSCVAPFRVFCKALWRTYTTHLCVGCEEVQTATHCKERIDTRAMNALV